MKKPYEIKKSKWFEDEPLYSWTSLGMGGKADAMCFVENMEELDFLLKYCKRENINYFILGGGTNLLFSDLGFRGIIIKFSGIFDRIEESKDSIRVGSGVLLKDLVKYYIDNNFLGGACLHGIPGNVGGAVNMNAGTRWGSISDIINSVNIYDRGWIKIEKDSFKYREGIKEIILFVEMKKEIDLKDKQKKVISEIIKYRKESLPKSNRTAGSVFKNPKNKFAGKLIEDLGYMGTTLNNINISNKHSNIFIAQNGAKAVDFISVVKMIKNEVKRNFLINLELELKIVDENGKYIKI